MQQLDNVLWAISIHALREEGDMPILRACLVRCLFLSTPSARRATRAVMETAQAIKNFYPRPPRGGRPGYPAQALWPCRDFYPRPPRGGRRRPA